MREAADGSANISKYHGEYTIEFGREAGRRFLAEGRPPTAIFASSDEIAIGLIEVLRAQGVSIPEDVSLVGFDDVGPLHLFAPPVTAIRQPVRSIGQRAVALLLETNWQESPGSFRETLLPVEIVVRKSVAPPAR